MNFIRTTNISPARDFSCKFCFSAVKSTNFRSTFVSAWCFVGTCYNWHKRACPYLCNNKSIIETKILKMSPLNSHVYPHPSEMLQKHQFSKCYKNINFLTMKDGSALKLHARSSTFGCLFFIYYTGSNFCPD